MNSVTKTYDIGNSTRFAAVQSVALDLLLEREPQAYLLAAAVATIETGSRPYPEEYPDYKEDEAAVRAYWNRKSGRGGYLTTDTGTIHHDRLNQCVTVTAPV
jgi:hypothetical protein